MVVDGGKAAGSNPCHAQHILNDEASKSHSGKSNHAYKVETLESIGLAQMGLTHKPSRSRSHG